MKPTKPTRPVRARRLLSKQHPLASPRHSPPKERTSWTPRVLLLLTLIGLTLTLLGYGVAMSVETMFLMPFSVVFSSSFELLQLSPWAIARFFDVFNRSFSLVDFLNQGVHQGMWVGLGVFAAVTLAGICLKVEAAKWWPRRLRWSALQELAAPPTERDPWWAVPLRIGAVSSLAAIMPVAGSLIALIALFAGLIGIVIIPYVGLKAGEAHIVDYVIKPRACAKLLNREERIKLMQRQVKRDASGRKAMPEEEKTATCVVIKQDGKIVAAGRVVFGLPEIIILFEPDGRVTRHPIKERIVEVVDQLPDAPEVARPVALDLAPGQDHPRPQ